MTTTGKLDPLPPDRWPDTLQSIVDDMRGRPLKIHSLIANNPALLQAWWPLRKHCVAGGSLGQRATELVILRTAMLLGSWYEWGSHVVRGMASGLTEDDIERVAGGPAEPGWSPAEEAMLAAVDELYTTRTMSDETSRALSAHLSHEQVLDLVALQSTYLMLGTLMNLWPVPLDEHVENALPEGAYDRFRELQGDEPG